MASHQDLLQALGPLGIGLSLVAGMSNNPGQLVKLFLMALADMPAKNTEKLLTINKHKVHGDKQHMVRASMHARAPACACTCMTGSMIPCMAAKRGPIALFCMPNRTILYRTGFGDRAHERRHSHAVPGCLASAAVCMCSAHMNVLRCLSSSLASGAIRHCGSSQVELGGARICVCLSSADGSGHPIVARLHGAQLVAGCCAMHACMHACVRQMLGAGRCAMRVRVCVRCWCRHSGQRRCRCCRRWSRKRRSRRATPSRSRALLPRRRPSMRRQWEVRGGCQDMHPSTRAPSRSVNLCPRSSQRARRRHTIHR
jgi:hypothetical protein